MLSLLLNKYVLVALAFAAILGWGTYERWQHHRWEQRYETFRIETAAVGMAAAAHAKEVTAANEKATQEIRLAAKRDRGRITAYYERLRLDAGSGVVPAPSNDPSRVDVTAIERVAGGQDFERACALDAQQLADVQAWVRRVGIPAR